MLWTKPSGFNTWLQAPLAVQALLGALAVHAAFLKSNLSYLK